MYRKLTGFVLLIAFSTTAAQRGTERELMRLSETLDQAVIALMDWGEHFPADARGVVGSAFVINQDGYFVTAAHNLDGYRPNSSKLTAILRQPDGSGSGVWFDVIERDVKRDIALCRIRNFEAIKKAATTKGHPKNIVTVPASLVLSPEKLVIGRFVVIAGFPLGSWNPSIQLGQVAATQTINPNAAVNKQVFQVSVAGNQGDSGGPVVDLHSGKVLGIIVKGSILIGTEGSNLTLQSSGILMAAPASWLQELLTKHNIKSAAFPLME